MKRNIIFLAGGIIAGIALCLTAASMVPVDPVISLADLQDLKH